MTKAVLLFSMLFTVFTGCLSMVDQDLSRLPPFQSFVGKTYTLQQESVLIRLPGKGKALHLMPYGGFNNTVPSKPQMETTPFRFGGLVIVGVVPVGGVFQVTRIFNNNTFEDSHKAVTAVLLSGGPDSFIGKDIRLDTFLEDVYSDEFPKFKESFLVP